MERILGSTLSDALGAIDYDQKREIFNHFQELIKHLKALPVKIINKEYHIGCFKSIIFEDNEFQIVLGEDSDHGHGPFNNVIDLWIANMNHYIKESVFESERCKKYKAQLQKLTQNWMSNKEIRNQEWHYYINHNDLNLDNIIVGKKVDIVSQREIFFIKAILDWEWANYGPCYADINELIGFCQEHLKDDNLLNSNKSNFKADLSSYYQTKQYTDTIQCAMCVAYCSNWFDKDRAQVEFENFVVQLEKMLSSWSI